MSEDPESCARVVLDVIPVVMRLIKAEMRLHRSADLSIPQFRTLTFLNRNSGASLYEVANHLGLTSPSTSSLVDELVKRDLIHRQLSTTDRRRITLVMTPLGETILKTARQETHSRLASILKELSPTDLELITQALLVLQSVIPEGDSSHPKMESNHVHTGS